MLDIKLIRENPDAVKKALARVGDTDSVDLILELDVQRREILAELEQLRSTRNAVSKEVASCKDADERSAKITSMKAVNDRIKVLDESIDQVSRDYQAALLAVPNIPDENAPDGPDDSANVVMAEYGTKPEFSFTPRPHWELGEAMNGIDFERGVKISGTRFYILKGPLAKLQRALIQFMLDLHVEEHGFTEVYPPFMVKEHCMYGTAQLPKFGDNLYYDAEDGFYFIPTAEVPLTNMYRDEILNAADLPIKHVAFTACFRREKMSAGKDTRGIKRGHQFDKVEMVVFTRPEESGAMLENITGYAAAVLEKLKLPYRKLNICTGDLSFSAAAKYDLEVWSAGCGEWLEVSSISNFKDFQARRAQIRYKEQSGDKAQFVHTLNGSGLALPRVMIAIMENYQTESGTIRVPEALLPYFGGLTELS